MIKPELIPSLIRQLQTANATALEYEVAGTLLSLKLAPRQASLPNPQGRPSNERVSEPAADNPTTQVLSPDMGNLCLAHPLSDQPPLCEGDRVARGDTVAYLRIGDALTPIITEVSGTLIRHLADDNKLVGYGCPVAEIASN